VLTVDAIVVNLDTRDLLRACLASLRTSAYPVRHTFVVDNASSDGSPEMVATEFPGTGLLRMRSNVGFACANNAAFPLTTADAVLLLNSDAQLSVDALGALIQELEGDPQVGAVGPVLMGADGRVQYEGGRRDPTILGEFGNISHLNVRLPRSPLGRYLMNDWDHCSSRDVEVVSGACVLLRRAALDGTLFREDFFMYAEDVELCQRLRASGWRVRYTGAAKVAHRGAATSRRARTRMRVAGVVSMAQLLARARSPLYAAAYLAVVPVAWPLGAVVRRVWPE
jgi:GT2 family glycosyltransferase